MNCMLGDVEPVCEGAAAAHDHVAGGRAQPSRGEGVERKQPPEVFLGDTQALQWRGRHRPAGEAPPGAVLVVEEREDRRVTVELGDRGEGALGAPHDEQVVVRDRDAR